MYKQALDREELLYLFWNMSEFAEMRNEMAAYVSLKVPGSSDIAIEETINRTLYQIALECYNTLDSIKSGDWLGLLRNSYFQGHFDGVRLTSNGMTRAEIKQKEWDDENKKTREKKKREWKRALIFYGIMCIAGIIYYLIQLLMK